MKHLKIIFLTFTIAFASSLLLDIPWVSDSWVRFSLTVLVILTELAIGLFYLKTISKK